MYRIRISWVVSWGHAVETGGKAAKCFVLYRTVANDGSELPPLPNPSFSFYIALCLLRGVTLCILPGNINRPAWMGFSFGRLVCILFGLIFSRRYIVRYDEHDQKWIVYINQAFRFRKKKMKKMILWRLFRYQHTGHLFQTKTGKEIIRLLELIPFFLI